MLQQGGKTMIDTERYTILEPVGYPTKQEAYEKIHNYYKDVVGVTAYYDGEGCWYIVQSKLLSNRSNKTKVK